MFQKGEADSSGPLGQGIIGAEMEEVAIVGSGGQAKNVL
jgi:hypothetical protein